MTKLWSQGDTPTKPDQSLAFLNLYTSSHSAFEPVQERFTWASHLIMPIYFNSSLVLRARSLAFASSSQTVNVSMPYPRSSQKLSMRQIVQDCFCNSDVWHPSESRSEPPVPFWKSWPLTAPVSVMIVQSVGFHFLLPAGRCINFGEIKGRNCSWLTCFSC